MRIAIIGRSEILYDSALELSKRGHEIAVIITAKEAPEYTRTAKDFKQLAKERGATFFEAGKIAGIADALSQLPPVDIGVSVNYTDIIPQAVIGLFRLGILNAHGGDLPRYRGNACQAWAILNGEKRIGLCIHKMEGGKLDSGDIIARDYFPIDLRTKVTEVHAWMTKRVPHLFAEALEALSRSPAYVLERQSAAALRCYPRRPEDGRIDWRQSAVQILRLINASNKPYAGAFCTFEGERMIIWDAEPVEDGENFLAVPGQVTRIGSGFVEAATGDGKLRFTAVEYRGKTCAPDIFIRSLRVRLEVAHD